MAKQDASYIIGIDVGTTKVCAVVAEVNEEGFLEVIGLGTADSHGLRKGAVVNLDATAASIAQAVEEAETMTGLTINAAHIGIAGASIKGYNSRGIIAISRRNREISEGDKQRVIDQARALSIPSDREVMDVLPQEYTVDGQDGIRDPVGMIGTRLEVSVHMVTSPITVRQNILTSVRRADLNVLDTVLAPLAAAEAVLTEDEKEFGVALVNIGGETTSIAVFQRGAVRYTAVIPVGGNHFTSDIALGLRTPIPEAERIKREYGCALTSLVPDVERCAVIEVPSVSGRQPLTLSRQILCDILQSRAEEIMTHVHQEILRAGYDRQLCSGIVLTGGGAMMDGLLDVAERTIDLPVRIGVPEGVGGLTERISSPAYATAVGLVLHGYRRQAEDVRPGQRSDHGISRATARLRGWLGGFFLG